MLRSDIPWQRCRGKWATDPTAPVDFDSSAPNAPVSGVACALRGKTGPNLPVAARDCRTPHIFLTVRPPLRTETGAAPPSCAPSRSQAPGLERPAAGAATRALSLASDLNTVVRSGATKSHTVRSLPIVAGRCAPGGQEPLARGCSDLLCGVPRSLSCASRWKPSRPSSCVWVRLTGAVV